MKLVKIKTWRIKVYSLRLSVSERTLLTVVDLFSAGVLENQDMLGGGSI